MDHCYTSNSIWQRQHFREKLFEQSWRRRHFGCKDWVSTLFFDNANKELLGSCEKQYWINKCPRKMISETVARGCSVKRFPEKFRKLHRKTSVMKCIRSKIGQDLQRYLKNDATYVFSWEFCKIFQSIFFAKPVDTCLWVAWSKESSQSKFQTRRMQLSLVVKTSRHSWKAEKRNLNSLKGYCFLWNLLVKMKKYIVYSPFTRLANSVRYNLFSFCSIKSWQPHPQSNLKKPLFFAFLL